MGGFGGAPIIVEPEGAENDVLAYLVFPIVVGEENVNVGLVSLEDFDDCGFDFGEGTDDAAHVGDYERVDEAL